MNKRALILFIMLLWMFFIVGWGSFDLPKVRYVTYIDFPNLTIEHTFMLVYFGVCTLLALSLVFDKKIKEVTRGGKPKNVIPFNTGK